MSFSFILLRGLIREAGHWGPFLDDLKEKFPDSTIACIDIPGAGVRYQDPSPTSMSEIVQIMREDFRRLKLPADRPVALVAISLGGMIAAQWFQSYPQDFQAVVLMNTSYGSMSPLWQRLQPKALQLLLKVPLLKGEAKEHRILEVVSNRQDKYQSVAERWGQIAALRPVSLANTFRQLFAAARFKTTVNKPGMPVLLLSSLQDRMVSVECMRTIAKAWKLPTVDHPTAGHDLPTDEPRWTAEQIHRFIANL
jgi:pimeloyl-ACP methyl ester carboxylesterase